MSMNERPEGWPRPGHTTELNEWARETDARDEQVIRDQLKASETSLKDFVTGVAGTGGLSYEQQLELTTLMASLEDVVAAHVMYRMSPKLTDVYDNQPTNS